MIALLPLWAMCDRWDIGGLSTNIHSGHGRGRRSSSTTATPAASASPSAASTQFEGWVADTVRLLDGCPCERGCPSCVQSPKCGNLNEWLDKGGALTLSCGGDVEFRPEPFVVESTSTRRRKTQCSTCS